MSISVYDISAISQSVIWTCPPPTHTSARTSKSLHLFLHKCLPTPPALPLMSPSQLQGQALPSLRGTDAYGVLQRRCGGVGGMGGVVQMLFCKRRGGVVQVVSCGSRATGIRCD